MDSKRKRGRPEKGPEDIREHRLTIRFTAGEWDKLTSLSAQNKTTRAGFMRSLLTGKKKEKGE